MTADDHVFMARAIRLARRGLYSCHPNPRVGCVLVRDGEIVGEGFHARAGGPHAEREALAAAGARARGATAYVSLEPCCHHGRTPPCADALIEAGISRVVAAMMDPNPRVAGQGLSQLEQAGIEVQCGLLEKEAEALNPGFIKRMRQGLPYVRCKLAMSLDGRTAMASGESKWITSRAARSDVQRLRAQSDAILTGVETVLADDPSLTVRLEKFAELAQPLRVVLDSRLRLSPASRLLGLPGHTLIMCAEGQDRDRADLEAAGARVAVLPADQQGRVGLRAALGHLAGEQINEVLLEAGPTLAGSALAQGLIDELVIYMAPHLMGDSGLGLFHIPGLARMQDRIDLEITDVRAVGRDWRITAVPRPVI